MDGDVLESTLLSASNQDDSSCLLLNTLPALLPEVVMPDPPPLLQNRIIDFNIDLNLFRIWSARVTASSATADRKQTKLNNRSKSIPDFSFAGKILCVKLSGLYDCAPVPKALQMCPGLKT